MSEPRLEVGHAAGDAAARRRRHTVEALVASTLALDVIAAGVWVRQGLTLSSDIPPIVFPVVLAAAMAYAIAGAIIVLRRPERMVGWVLVALGMLVAGVYLGLAIASGSASEGSPSDVAVAAAVSSVSLLSPATVATGATFGLIFPTGRTLGRLGVWGIRLAWAGAAVTALGQLLRPGPLFILRDISNPFASPTTELLGSASLGLGVAMLLVASFLAGLSLIIRYRASETTRRRQIRLVVAAGGSLALATFAFISVSYLGTTGPLLDICTLTLASTLLLSPVAILVAMVRYRLYEIDRLVGRTFVIASLTAILAGAFAATQRLLQAIFVAVLGESSDLTLVFSTLLIVAAITPLKERLEAIVDRWDGERTRTEPGSVAPIVTTALDPALAAAIDARIEQRLRELLPRVAADEVSGSDAMVVADRDDASSSG